MATTFQQDRPIGRIQGLRTRIPEVGRIKIGVRGKTITSRSGTDFQPPKKLDHFEVTRLDRARPEGDDRYGRFVKDGAIHAEVGDEPRELPVRLVFDDPAANLFSEYAVYRSRRRWCHGDGRRAERIDENGQWRDRSCPCNLLEERTCKPYGVFRCLLDVPGVPGLGGVYVFRTTSRNTIENLYSSQDWISKLTGGRLSNIPMLLRLVRRTVEIEQKGSLMQTTFEVVTLQFAGAIDELRDYAIRAIEAERGYADRLRLIESRAASDVVTEEDEAEVADEFYAEQIDEDGVVIEAEAKPVEQEQEQEQEQEGQGAEQTTSTPKTLHVLGKDWSRLGDARNAMLKAIAGTSTWSEELRTDAAKLASALRKSGRTEMAEEIEQRAAEKMMRKQTVSEDDDAPPPEGSDGDGPAGDDGEEGDIPDLDL